MFCLQSYVNSRSWIWLIIINNKVTYLWGLGCLLLTVLYPVFLISEEFVVYVKQEMQTRGFLSREFASLPNDMASGSRELLLGFAWLLCKESLVDKFMESCASPLDEEDPSFMYEVWKNVGQEKKNKKYCSQNSVNIQ